MLSGLPVGFKMISSSFSPIFHHWFSVVCQYLAYNWKSIPTVAKAIGMYYYKSSPKLTMDQPLLTLSVSL